MQNLQQRSTTYEGPYFEGQQAAQCGRHALNNLYGGPQFTVEDLSNACSLVLGDLSENAGVDEPRSRHELPSGWYSHSVLAKAFDLLSTPEWRLLPAVARPSEWTRFFDPRVKGCLVNQDNQHWVSIKSHGDRVLLFDSQKKALFSSCLLYTSDAADE